jgi:hypothetical protein
MSVPGGHRPTGFVVLALAVVMLGIACLDPSVPLEKRWLIVICALAFFIAALQILTAAKGRASYVFGGSLLALLSSLGFYAAFSSQTVEGGIPFIPPSWNQALGHGLFGCCALLTAAFAAYYFYKAFKGG